MPYIKLDDRRRFLADLDSINQEFNERGVSRGDLNFLVSTLCKYYMDQHGQSYSIINDIVGVLECAKMEFYRRVAVPYEDKKRTENGDVY